MVDSDVLEAELQRLAEYLGQPPTQSDVNDLTARSHSTYARAFGGWNEALEHACGDVNHRVNKGRVVIECDGPGCTEPVRKTSAELEDSEHHHCSNECKYAGQSERYEGVGNPRSTLEPVECDACGETILRARWERERYERVYCSGCWGDSQQPIECEWCGGTDWVWPARVEIARFCGQECLDEWRAATQVGENHPRWRPGRRPEYYGPNWHEQRRRAIIRDQARCQDCGMTMPESLEEFGAELTVHHETPLREFVDGDDLDHEAANRLENLVTLCVSCHGAASRD